MFVKTIAFIFLSLLFPCFSASAVELFSGDKLKQNEKLLVTLDSLLAHREVFVNAKEERILQLKKQKAKVSTLEEQYLMNKLIYDEYRVYNADSALHYIEQNKRLATQSNNREWMVTSLVEQSFVLSATGFLKEATEAISGIQASNLSRSVRSKYYGQMRSLYSRLSNYSSGNPELSHTYNELQRTYLDSVCITATPNEPRYLYSLVWKHIGTPAIKPVKAALEKKIKTLPPDTRTYAMAASNLALIYKHEGNEEKYLEFLILSGMADIRSANGDISSLQDLAEYLFAHGEIDRAYSYINYCSQNAQAYRNRVRAITISKLQSSIHQAYQEQNEQQRKRLHIVLVVVSLLSLVLVGAFLFIRSQMKHLAESSHKLDEANKLLNSHMRNLSDAHQRLEEANEQLKDLNKQLHEVNAQLQESNYVKEEYIGYVFNICSTYIGKLEEFRKNINRKLKVGQIEEAQALTGSSSMAVNELKEFYQNFDTIFLHLYPGFVEEFNALLLPEERIELKEGELLNTELRIQALVRLGITDSVKIADFLHCSPQTIYNNRLKTRNKASGPKEEFANAVKRLGKYNVI